MNFIRFNMYAGNEYCYNLLIDQTLVHIDDLVSPHIFLFENPYAKGRYICSSIQISLEEMSIFLYANYLNFMYQQLSE